MFEPITWVHPDKSTSVLHVEAHQYRENVTFETTTPPKLNDLIRWRGTTYRVIEVTGIPEGEKINGPYTVWAEPNRREK